MSGLSSIIDDLATLMHCGNASLSMNGLFSFSDLHWCAGRQAFNRA